MTNINQIMMQIDYAYALLNQKTITHISGMKITVSKPVTMEDVNRVKEILRDTFGDLKAIQASLESITKCN